MRAGGARVTVEPFEIAPNIRAAYVMAPDDIELELLQRWRRRALRREYLPWTRRC